MAQKGHFAFIWTKIVYKCDLLVEFLKIGAKTWYFHRVFFSEKVIKHKGLQSLQWKFVVPKIGTKIAHINKWIVKIFFRSDFCADFYAEMDNDSARNSYM